MGNPIAPYVSQDAPTGEEFRRLRIEIGEAITQTLSPREVEAVNRQRTSRGGLPLCRQEDLAPILDRRTVTISSYENGHMDIPLAVMQLLRSLHKKVTENPTLARLALLEDVQWEAAPTDDSQTPN